MCLLTLPYPPSANRYWRTVGGRVLVSAEAREYKRRTGWEALARGAAPVAGPVMVTLRVYRPRRRGDLDNAIKILLDSLCGIAFEDDSQVVELHAFQYDDPERPRVEVIVEQVP